MIHNEKYRVFKRDDFQKFTLACNSDPTLRYKLVGTLKMDDLAEELEIQDAVVIRLQDVFAGPALEAYANSIEVAMQFVDNEFQHKRLSEIAGYFRMVATEARQMADADRKVPD